jgi:hypothetical protein
MTIGTSLFLIAVGAILRYGLTVDTIEGIDLDTTGLILMIVGAVGQIIGLWLLARGSPSGTAGTPPPP